MALKFFQRAQVNPVTEHVTISELMSDYQELSIRAFAFEVCVDMVANALGRCEFRTFLKNEEVYDQEYYLWNVEPNTNQNSTAFLHKLVNSLYHKNEVLVISSRKKDGMDALVVADAWQDPEKLPSRQNEYRSVRVEKFEYSKTFKEADVIHLVLNHKEIAPILKGIASGYERLMSGVSKAYEWNHGKHWKVHVSQMARGSQDWAKNFQAMLTEQFKPFLNNSGSILPEMDGYDYQMVKGEDGSSCQDIQAFAEEIFNLTARAFLIPIVLVNGKVEATADANSRFLTNVIDPICDQLQEEIIRKRYGFQSWKDGARLQVDSSSIIHFDMFSQAAAIEKLVGSGVFTVNDVRKASGQPVINEPWADEHFVTRNFATMDEALTATTAERR